MTAEDAAVVMNDERIARTSSGQPMASPEIVVVVCLKRRADGTSANVIVRGVSQSAFRVRSVVKVVNGRSFIPGRAEVIVGERIWRRIEGLDVGRTLLVQKLEVTVVGVFRSEGNAFESEVWGDANLLASAFHRSGTYQSVTIRLANPRAIDELRRDIERSERFQLGVLSERQYYDEQAKPVANALLGLAALVSLVMGTGAVFAVLNTMDALIATRTREIGILRSLGFSRTSIMVGFIVESVVLALAGGVLGSLMALPFEGVAAATSMGFSELEFPLRITPHATLVAIAFVVILGALGGILPAVRGTRMAIVDALRSG